MARTYEATIKLPKGGTEKIRVEAANSDHARQLLELQYGPGRVINLSQKS